MSLEIVEVSGAELEPYLDGLGRLRIAVFREWPYLYDGSLDYEREYLRSYLNCERSLVALVLDEGEPVGATTCMPLAEEGPEFQAPFKAGRYDLGDVCYFGESMLLPSYRGRGLGKEFFTRREAHAARLGAVITTFCAVDRAPDDPRQPEGYRSLHGFWSALGYEPQPHLRAEFRWKEIGEPEESPKSLTFWTKSWR